jgi:hypothetical protein
MLYGLGTDDGQFEDYLRSTPHRAVAVTLAGFGLRVRHRPVLSVDDHSRVLRLLLRELVAELQPKRTVLVGHTTGADQFLRLLADESGAGVEISGLVAYVPNVSLETCFATRLYARLDSSDSAGTLTTLKTLAADIDELEVWVMVQHVLTRLFLRFGSDLEPLRRYARRHRGTVRAARRSARGLVSRRAERIPGVRLVFTPAEAEAAEGCWAATSRATYWAMTSPRTPSISSRSPAGPAGGRRDRAPCRGRVGRLGEVNGILYTREEWVCVV